MKLSTLSVILLLGVAAIASSCGGGGGGGGSGSTPPPPVATASPAGGVYASTQMVTLASNRPATIYYTLNGNAPSVGAPGTLSGPSPLGVQVSSDTALLQFFAVDSSGAQGAAKSETYAINGGAATGPGDAQDYFPLAVGDSWTTRVTVTQTGSPPSTFFDTSSITGTQTINGASAFILTDANSGNTGQPLNEYLLKSTNGLVFLGNNDPSDILTSEISPNYLAQLPGQAGSSFVQVDKAGLDFGLDLDGDGKNETAKLASTVSVKGIESVTVPAGTFSNSLKIETDQTLTVVLSSDGTTVTVNSVQTQWFAPGVGPVKTVIVTTGGNFTSTETDELMSAAIAAPFLGTATSFGAGTLPNSVAIGDFDGNGKADLAVTNQGNPSTSFADSSVSVLLGDGSGSFGAATNFLAGTVPISSAIGDFNGDGKPDLAVANFGSNSVSILIGKGDGTFGAPTDFTVAAGNPSAVVTGDFNGDGKLDLAVVNGFPSNLTPGHVSILLGKGDGTFGSATDFTVGSDPRSVTIGDFNGDGKLDLAVGNSLGGNVSVLLGDGAGSFGAAANFAVGDFPGAVAVADFNGDGKPDLAVASGSTVVNNSNVSILLGDGTGSFGTATPHIVDPEGALITGIAIGDFNRDGKLDIVVTNAEAGNPGQIRGNAVVVLLGDGAGAFGAVTYFAPVGSQPGSLATADLNGDGKPDLAMASSNGVSLILNTSP